MNFDLIFAQNAKPLERYEWDEINYKRGWGYLGYSIPPPMELFNQMQYINDMKSKFLYDETIALRQELDSKIAEVGEQINEIKGDATTSVSELEKKIDEFEQRNLYTFKGTVQHYSDLPSEGNKNGDVYNILISDKTNKIKAGDNVAWNGTEWDNLSGGEDLDYISNNDIDKIIGGNQ